MEKLQRGVILSKCYARKIILAVAFQMPIKGKFIFQSTGKSIITLTKDRVNLDFNISCVNGKTFYCKFNPYPALMYIAACKTVMCTCYFLLFQQWHPFGEGLNAFFVVLSLSWQKDIHKKMSERHDVVWAETKKDNWNRMRSANHWDQKRSWVWVDSAAWR